MPDSEAGAGDAGTGERALSSDRPTGFVGGRRPPLSDPPPSRLLWLPPLPLLLPLLLLLLLLLLLWGLPPGSLASPWCVTVDDVETWRWGDLEREREREREREYFHERRFVRFIHDEIHQSDPEG